MSTIADYSLHGFDTNHGRATPDYTADGRVFTILKASQGVGFVDSKFAERRDAAHKAGVVVGLYHFGTPLDHAAADEAAHFLAAIGDVRPNEFLILDFEKNPEDKSGRDFWNESWAVMFLEAVKRSGAPVVFYSYRAAITSHTYSKIQATGAALWVASYNESAPSVPGWPWTFWQHTNAVNGQVDGPHDCSVFHSNNLNDLAAFVGEQGDDDMPLNGDDKKWLTDNTYNIMRGFTQLVLDKLGGAGTHTITEGDLAAIAKSVNDEEARRQAS